MSKKRDFHAFVAHNFCDKKAFETIFCPILPTSKRNKNAEFQPSDWQR